MITTLYSSSIHSSSRDMCDIHVFTSLPPSYSEPLTSQLEQKNTPLKKRKKKRGKVSGERKRALWRLEMSLSAIVVRPLYEDEAMSWAGLLLSDSPSVFPHHHLSCLRSLHALPALCICYRTGWPFSSVGLLQCWSVWLDCPPTVSTQLVGWLVFWTQSTIVDFYIHFLKIRAEGGFH